MTVLRPLDYFYENTHITFFRCHVVAFTIIPLIASAVFFAANTEYFIPFIDCVFLCYSMMTGTGLATVNLSTLSGFQQSILFVLSWMGDTTFISFIMVLIRRHYFRSKCEVVARCGGKLAPRPISKLEISAPIVIPQPVESKKPTRPGSRSKKSILFQDQVAGLDAHDSGASQVLPLKESTEEGIHRMNPHNPPQTSQFATQTVGAEGRPPHGVDLPERHITLTLEASRSNNIYRRPASRMVRPPEERLFDFFSFLIPSRFRRQITRTFSIPRTTTYNALHHPHKYPGAPLDPSSVSREARAPGLHRDAETGLWHKAVNWLSFDGLKVGRNSLFHYDSLTDEQLGEIGGTEYRALTFLAYFIPAYFLGTQFLSFLIFAPYLISTSRWDDVFKGQPRLVPKAWFSAFQVVAAYTGCGLSLVDASMVPFQTMYPMIISLMFVILAGKNGLPVFLRFIIWLCTKVVPPDSRANETLHFLLDHPRRCYLYLFPSHQTWFLLGTLLLFSLVDWSCFMVLDVGLPVTSSLSIGVQILVGLFQGIATRGSGFAIINVSALAPSVQFLYVILMYIAIYPLAISIRATNVYEERSLGVFEVPVDENEPEVEGSRNERIGKYFGWHVRRQLANDIWWVVGGVWLILIIERGKVMDNQNAPWFNTFRIIFELVSAFSGIGLSLGIPDQNYSFVGSFRKLSKLVVIVLMVRGRQRELPLSIDRAVMLPAEFKNQGIESTCEVPPNDNAQPSPGFEKRRFGRTFSRWTTL